MDPVSEITEFVAVNFTNCSASASRNWLDPRAINWKKSIAFVDGGNDDNGGDDDGDIGVVVMITE